MFKFFAFFALFVFGLADKMFDENNVAPMGDKEMTLGRPIFILYFM